MGSLSQLVAYGAQDVYLTGNPQTTYFRTIYRRYTNFANIDNVNDFANIDNVNNFANLFDINEWPIELMLLLETDRNIECPISLEIIKLDDQYCRCVQCKYNFSKNALISAFKNKRSCPMCRSDWKDKIVYINKSLD
jgi:hypothetical protein